MKKQKNPVSKIKSISIEGFRAFNTRQQFPVRPINLIFGPNSSGKSALIKGILYSLEEGNTKQLDLNGLNRFAANEKHTKGSCRFSYELDVNSFPRITDRKHLSEDMKETLFKMSTDESFTFTHFVDTLNYPGNHGYALEYGDYKVFNENYFDGHTDKASIVPFWNRMQIKIDEIFNSNHNIAKYLDTNSRSYFEFIKKLSTGVFTSLNSFEVDNISSYNDFIYAEFENNYFKNLYADKESSDRIRFELLNTACEQNPNFLSEKGIKFFHTILTEILSMEAVIKAVTAEINDNYLAENSNISKDYTQTYLKAKKIGIQKRQNSFIKEISENRNDFITDEGRDLINEILNHDLYITDEKKEEMSQDILNGVSWAFDEIRDADKSGIVSDSSIRSLRDLNLTKAEIYSYTAELIILAVHDIKQIYMRFFEFRPADVAKMLYLGVERESVDFGITNYDFEKSPLNQYLRDEKCLEFCNSWFKKSDIPFKLIEHEQLVGRFSGHPYFESNNLPINIMDLRVGQVFPLKDVGYGLKKLIPVLAAVSYQLNAVGYHDKLGKYNLVAIEEPEIHLHPKLQSALGDLFVDNVVDGSGKTYFIEMHSENLLQRILRRVREGVISHEAINVLYVQPGVGKEGAKVINLRINAEGKFLDRWPEGFFEPRMDDVITGL